MKKLKKWQIVLIVILALGVIGALAGRGDEEKKNGEPAAEKTDNKKKEDKKKEPKEESRPDGHAEGGFHCRSRRERMPGL